MTCLLDAFSRESFLVDEASGELNPPGWVRGPFGLFFDLQFSRWVLTHRPSKKVFQSHFLSIESACQAVFELEALSVDWSQKEPRVDHKIGQRVVEILKRLAEPEAKPSISELSRRLQELL